MFPKLLLVKQTNPAARSVEDAFTRALEQLRSLELPPERLQGRRIGVTVGSRGIDRLPELVMAVCGFLKERGARPVIFAAMGSHGGGTADGQREMLYSLGITENAVGAPVECCADCRLLGTTASGFPVYCNRLAYTFDGIVVLNRVKPHTDFSGETESGLLKMLAIGVGNPAGCKQVHALAVAHGYETVIRETAALMLEKLPVLCGLMVTENWKSRLDSITAALPPAFYERERERLAAVKAHQVKLPVKELDVLLVREIGKNISGAGMDTKVIGRIMIKGQTEPAWPRIGRICVFSITPASHGNAIGLGLSDFTTLSVVGGVQLQATALNAVSSAAPEQGRIPCVMETERDAVAASLSTLGIPPQEEERARIIYIRNTGSLEVLAVSEAVYESLRDSGTIEALSAPEEMRFSEKGALLNFADELGQKETR